jgi:hypothetical protein
MKNILRWNRETASRNKHLKKHPEDDDQELDGMNEISKLIYKEKVQKKAKKRRKKRYRKLWGNCVPFSNYKGFLIIDQEMVLYRRRSRYHEENLLYFEHVLSKKENVIKETFKDNSLKSYYGKPYGSKHENLGCERDGQTFYQSSAVDESDGAAENEFRTQNRICRQISVVECTNCLENGIICFSSETNPKDPVDLFCIKDDSSSSEKFVSRNVAFSESNCPTFYLNNSNNSFHAPTVGFEAR